MVGRNMKNMMPSKEARSSKGPSTVFRFPGFQFRKLAFFLDPRCCCGLFYFIFHFFAVAVLVDALPALWSSLTCFAVTGACAWDPDGI